MKIMRIIVIFLVFLVLFSCEVQVKVQPAKEDFWTDGYCQQKSVNHVTADMEEICFQLEGKWVTLPLVDFPQSFVGWNQKSRLGFLEQIGGVMRGEGGGSIDLADPHNGIVATTGFKREDSNFSLNNAVKGMGFLPKAEKMDELLKLLNETEEAPMPRKLEILVDLYENLEENFDLNKQVSLELYSNPEFMTQSFLNQVYNPISTVVFLDIPSFKLKTVARLLDPNDPNLNDYEQKVVEWINEIHNYFHGPFDMEFMGVIYYALEVYDNSPMGENPETGMGRRVMPPLP